MIESCQLAAGDLSVSPLAAVLLQALRERATGVLEIDARGGVSRIYFRAGHPAGTQVFFGFRSLGHFLLELGWIDIDGFERSLAGVARGRMQGQMLVELGILSEERLHLGLGLHQQAQLRTLATLEEGSYRFLPGPDLPPWTADLRMSAHRAIVDALTAAPGQRLAGAVLSRIPPGQGLVLRDGWERGLAPFELDAWEERFVARLIRPQRPEGVVAGAPVPPEKARALAACLAIMGLARPVPLPGERAPGPTEPGGSVGFGRDVVRAPPPAAPLTPGTPGPGNWGFTPGPFTPGPFPPEPFPPGDVPPPPPSGSGTPPPREAGPAEPPPRPAAPARTSDAADSRARRARLLRRAFGNIPGAPPPFRGEGPELPPAPGSREPADVASRLAAIRERHARIAGEDHFQRLSLPRTASREQVKRAFFEAAKRYHPDRMPAELAPVSRELGDIFQAVHEAYEVLQDEERRRAYEASLEGASLPAVDERIRALSMQADHAMRRRAWAEAERAYRKAAALGNRPDLLAHAAWAVLSDPARRDEVPRARTELSVLAASSPTTAAPHYYLGVIARAEGDEKRAERCFRQALQANPKHAEAAQELRLLAARKRRAGGKR